MAKMNCTLPNSLILAAILSALASVCLVECYYHIKGRKPQDGKITEVYEWLAQFDPDDNNFCLRVLKLQSDINRKKEVTIFSVFKISLLKTADLLPVSLSPLEIERKLILIPPQMENEKMHVSLAYLKIVECVEKYETPQNSDIETDSKGHLRSIRQTNRERHFRQLKHITQWNMGFLLDRESIDDTIDLAKIDMLTIKLLEQIFGSYEKADSKVLNSKAITRNLPPENPKLRIFARISKNSIGKEEWLKRIIYILSNSHNMDPTKRCSWFIKMFNVPYEKLIHETHELAAKFSTKVYLEYELSEEDYEKFVDAFMTFPPEFSELYVEIVACGHSLRYKSEKIEEMMKLIESHGLFNDLIDPRIEKNNPESGKMKKKSEKYPKPMVYGLV